MDSELNRTAMAGEYRTSDSGPVATHSARPPTTQEMLQRHMLDTSAYAHLNRAASSYYSQPVLPRPMLDIEMNMRQFAKNAELINLAAYQKTLLQLNPHQQVLFPNHMGSHNIKNEPIEQGETARTISPNFAFPVNRLSYTQNSNWHESSISSKPEQTQNISIDGNKCNRNENAYPHSSKQASYQNNQTIFTSTPLSQSQASAEQSSNSVQVVSPLNNVARSRDEEQHVQEPGITKFSPNKDQISTLRQLLRTEQHSPNAKLPQMSTKSMQDKSESALDSNGCRTSISSNSNARVDFPTARSPKTPVHSPEPSDSSSNNGIIQVKKETDLIDCDVNCDSDASNCREISSGETYPHNNDGQSTSDNNVEVDKHEVYNNTDEQKMSENYNFLETKNILSCTFCEFETDLPHDYDNHVKTSHGTTCFNCNFVANDLHQLMLHRESCPNIETKLPSPPSKQKTKSKKLVCKVCLKHSENEEDFYNHRSTHISAEKILRCPKCHFLTQYKHHLDYHVKNHSGDKPFKCKECSYQCVNKSMLNSHMKSHSNFYSYRCKDCNYEAKYMHALKCHCRKYKHDAQPVINPDGTVNPFPIVDIYGNRRGPKIKRDSDGNPIYPPHHVTANIKWHARTGDSSPSSTPSLSSGANVSPPMPFCFSNNPFYRLHETPPGPSAMSTFPGINLSMLRNNSSNFNTPSPLVPQHLSFLNSPQSPHTPKNIIESLVHSFPNSISNIVNKTLEESSAEAFRCSICDDSFPAFATLQNHIILSHIIPANRRNSQSETPTRAPIVPPKVEENAGSDIISQLLKARFIDKPSNLLQHPISQYQAQNMQPHPEHVDNYVNDSENNSPLDLTKDHTPPQQIMRRRLSESSLDVSPSSLTPPDTCSPPKKARRDNLMAANRRLEDINEIVSSSVEGNQISDTSESASICKKEVEVFESQSEPQRFALDCTFCKITFGFEDMYSKHIEFHNIEDPLKCSFCSEKYKDFSAFFDHCYGCKNRRPVLESL